MSRLINYPTGWTVTRNNYVGDTACDIYLRNLIESSVLPCIYNGFQVTVNAGLVVSVSPGYARGVDLEFTQEPGTPNLPTVVDIATTSNVTCTASSTGWIVLNINVIGTLSGVPQTPGPTIPADYYDVNPTTTSGGTTINPVFVTSLAPVGPQGSFPYTQIVLAKVVTGASTITSIDQTYNPNPSLSNRSFDFSQILQGIFFTAFDNGEEPTEDNQLTNKLYVNSPQANPLLPKVFGTIVNNSGTYSVEVNSFNIASVTKDSVGNVTVVFIDALSDEFYTPQVSGSYFSGGAALYGYIDQTPGSVAVQIRSLVGADVDSSFSIAIFANN